MSRYERKPWDPRNVGSRQNLISLNSESAISLQDFGGNFPNPSYDSYPEEYVEAKTVTVSPSTNRQVGSNENSRTLQVEPQTGNEHRTVRRNRSFKGSESRKRSGSLVKYLAEDTDLKGRWGDNVSSRREARLDASKYRKGPIPVEDLQKSDRSLSQFSHSQLDSDIEDNEVSEKLLANDQSLPGSRGLLIYFARLTQSTEDENVDFHFIDSLLVAGADINFTDRHGQTILHSIARDWHPDIARFVIDRGAKVDALDRFGRTPLHVAAAFDYPEMVDFLVAFGANIEAKTKGEMQTPLHYAAKNNAISALKTLVKLGASINERDYKTRTPLFVAAELGRIDSTKYLLDIGAPAGVYDKGGNSAVAVMVEKMPSNAREALGQFYMTDRAFRKDYYYLSYLDHEKNKHRTMQQPLAKTPLELICFYKELDLVMHPVIRKLIEVKWNLFGRKYTIFLLILNLLYTFIWTILGFLVPRDGLFYTPLKDNSWRITLEILLVLMTIYFIVKQMIDARKAQMKYNEWKDWRIRDIERDFTYCHPKWPEERRFVEGEVQRLKNYKGSYFQNFWNVFEWISLLAILGVVLSRILFVSLGSENKTKLLNAHRIVYCLALLLIWIRMMKVFQGFAFLSSFITLLGHVITDTLKFAFLFFEFFIPYCCAFWMMFGGPENAKIFKAAGANDAMFSTISELIYTVWTMTLVGDFPYEGMVKIDEALAQLLSGTYFALVSLVCVNLYIALMSETFSRVYANAQANAAIQQAGLMLSFEADLTAKERKKMKKYLMKHCGPLEEFSDHQKYADNEKSDEMKRLLISIGNGIDSVKDKISEFENEVGERFALQELRRDPVVELEKRMRHMQKNHDALLEKIEEAHEKILDRQQLILDSLRKGGFKMPSLFSGTQEETEENNEETGVKSLLGNFSRIFTADKAQTEVTNQQSNAAEESKSDKQGKESKDKTNAGKKEQSDKSTPKQVTSPQETPSNDGGGKRRRRRGRSSSRSTRPGNQEQRKSSDASSSSNRLQIPKSKGKRSDRSDSDE